MQETQETWAQSLGGEDSWGKEMAAHSSVLAWRVPWTEEPGGLQSTGSQRVRHDLAAEHTRWRSWCRPVTPCSERCDLSPWLAQEVLARMVAERWVGEVLTAPQIGKDRVGEGQPHTPTHRLNL